METKNSASEHRARSPTPKARFASPTASMLSHINATNEQLQALDKENKENAIRPPMRFGQNKKTGSNKRSTSRDASFNVSSTSILLPPQHQHVVHRERSAVSPSPLQPQQQAVCEKHDEEVASDQQQQQQQQPEQKDGQEESAFRRSDSASRKDVRTPTPARTQKIPRATASHQPSPSLPTLQQQQPPLLPPSDAMSSYQQQVEVQRKAEPFRFHPSPPKQGEEEEEEEEEEHDEAEEEEEEHEDSGKEKEREHEVPQSQTPKPSSAYVFDRPSMTPRRSCDIKNIGTETTTDENDEEKETAQDVENASLPTPTKPSGGRVSVGDINVSPLSPCTDENNASNNNSNLNNSYSSSCAGRISRDRSGFLSTSFVGTSANAEEAKPTTMQKLSVPRCSVRLSGAVNISVEEEEEKEENTMTEKHEDDNDTSLVAANTSTDVEPRNTPASSIKTSATTATVSQSPLSASRRSNPFRTSGGNNISARLSDVTALTAATAGSGCSSIGRAANDESATSMGSPLSFQDAASLVGASPAAEQTTAPRASGDGSVVGIVAAAANNASTTSVLSDTTNNAGNGSASKRRSKSKSQQQQDSVLNAAAAAALVVQSVVEQRPGDAMVQVAALFKNDTRTSLLMGASPKHCSALLFKIAEEEEVQAPKQNEQEETSANISLNNKSNESNSVDVSAMYTGPAAAGVASASFAASTASPNDSASTTTGSDGAFASFISGSDASFNNTSNNDNNASLLNESSIADSKVAQDLFARDDEPPRSGEEEEEEEKGRTPRKSIGPIEDEPKRVAEDYILDVEEEKEQDAVQERQATPPQMAMAMDDVDEDPEATVEKYLALVQRTVDKEERIASHAIQTAVAEEVVQKRLYDNTTVASQQQNASFSSSSFVVTNTANNHTFTPVGPSVAKASKKSAAKGVASPKQTSSGGRTKRGRGSNNKVQQEAEVESKKSNQTSTPEANEDGNSSSTKKGRKQRDSDTQRQYKSKRKQQPQQGAKVPPRPGGMGRGKSRKQLRSASSDREEEEEEHEKDEKTPKKHRTERKSKLDESAENLEVSFQSDVDDVEDYDSISAHVSQRVRRPVDYTIWEKILLKETRVSRRPRKSARKSTTSKNDPNNSSVLSQSASNKKPARAASRTPARKSSRRKSSTEKASQSAVKPRKQTKAAGKKPRNSV